MGYAATSPVRPSEMAYGYRLSSSTSFSPTDTQRMYVLFLASLQGQLIAVPCPISRNFLLGSCMRHASALPEERRIACKPRLLQPLWLHMTESVADAPDVTVASKKQAQGVRKKNEKTPNDHSFFWHAAARCEKSTSGGCKSSCHSHRFGNPGRWALLRIQHIDRQGCRVTTTSSFASM